MYKRLPIPGDQKGQCGLPGPKEVSVFGEEEERLAQQSMGGGEGDEWGEGGKGGGERGWGRGRDMGWGSGRLMGNRGGRGCGGCVGGGGEEGERG